MPMTTQDIAEPVAGNSGSFRADQSVLNSTVVAKRGPGAVTATVPGIALGDVVTATFAGAGPTGLVITDAQVTAANTVLAIVSATQMITLAAGPQNVNFVWTR